MGLPNIRISSRMPTEVLEVIDGLTRELRRQHAEQAATPEEARRANVAIRKEQRERNNFYAELESQANELLAAVGHDAGPLSYHAIADIADHLNFELRFISSLPHSTRSVTDLKNRIIFLADARNPDHDPRSVALQALVSYVLGHGEPVDYKDFLRQRVYTNYMTAALMMPEKPWSKCSESAKRIAILQSKTYETPIRFPMNLLRTDLPIWRPITWKSNVTFKKFMNQACCIKPMKTMCEFSS